MTFHTRIVYKRGETVIGTDHAEFRGRWIGNAESKAMRYASATDLYLRSDHIRFESTPVCSGVPAGGITTHILSWILCHPVRP